MKAETFFLGIIVALTVGEWGYGSADAALPDDQIVQYIIREDPTDAESDVVFGFEFTLHAVGTDGGSVEWELTQVVFVEVDTNGAAGADWEDASASFSTSNGRWWVQHADPQKPAFSEFASPPVLEGRAQAADPADADLDYTIEGATCNGTCQQMFAGNVGALDYELTDVGEQQARELGVDETVAIEDDDALPPIGA